MAGPAIMRIGNPVVQDFGGKVVRNFMGSFFGPSGTWGRGRGTGTGQALPDWLAGPFTMGIGAVSPNLPFRVNQGSAVTPGTGAPGPVLASLNSLPGSPGGGGLGRQAAGLK